MTLTPCWQVNDALKTVNDGVVCSLLQTHHCCTNVKKTLFLIHISPVYFCLFVLDQARTVWGGVTLAWCDHAALTHIGHLGNGERS